MLFENAKLILFSQTAYFFSENIQMNTQKKMSNKISTKLKLLILLSPAVRTGLEPATPCVTGRYSNQLNYRTKVSMSALDFLVVCECKGNMNFNTVQIFFVFFSKKMILTLFSDEYKRAFVVISGIFSSCLSYEKSEWCYI